MLATVCEVCAKGRAAMDAGNYDMVLVAASLAPALEEMTQLTSLDLGGARARFGRGSGGLRGSLCLSCVLFGYVLGCDVLW